MLCVGSKRSLHLQLLFIVFALHTAASSESLEWRSLKARLSLQMNGSADPCEDFYSYACGNFPALTAYNPRKVKSGMDFSEYLYEDVATQIRDRVESKLYEVLVVEGLAVDSDPDIQSLYKLTRLFFSSCSKWIQNSDSFPGYKDKELSVSFLKAILNGLVKKLQQAQRYSLLGISVQKELTLEAVLASIARSGSKGMLSARQDHRFESGALNKKYKYNITKDPPLLVDSQINYWSNRSDVHVGGKQYDIFINFLLDNNITWSGLTQRNDSDQFSEIANGMRLSERRMKERIANDCNIQDVTDYSIAELDAKSRCANPDSPFSWSLYFEELLKRPADPKMRIQHIRTSSTIAVLNYFKSQPVLAQGGGERLGAHVSYIIFDWLMSFGDFLPRDLRHTWLGKTQSNYFYPPMRSDSGKIPDCMFWTKSYLKSVVGHMFQSAYLAQAIDDVKDLIALIRNASIEAIRRESSWTQAVDREAMINKISTVEFVIGLEEITGKQLKQLYKTALEEFRTIESDLPARSGLEYYFGRLMSIAMAANEDNKFNLLLGRSQATASTLMDQFDLLNYNDFGKIVLSMALLQAPLYHPTYPKTAKLSGLGFQVAREIGHLFDNYNYKRNHFGEDGSRWGDTTEAGYLQRTDCVRSCYGNYTLYPGGPKCRSESTLNNDIADIVGVRAAFEAFQMLKPADRGPITLTSPDQTFFILLAQGWCTRAETVALLSEFGTQYQTKSVNHARVTGTAQNSWEFARAFKCRPGQAMHPSAPKCTFW